MIEHHALSTGQQTGDTAEKGFWRTNTLRNWYLCQKYSSVFSGKMGMSHLCLKDSEITSAVSNPSAAGAGAYQQAARSAWQRTGACQPRWNVRDGNKTGAVLHFLLMHFFPSPHSQQARGRLLRSANTDVVQPHCWAWGMHGNREPELRLNCCNRG